MSRWVAFYLVLGTLAISTLSGVVIAGGDSSGELSYHRATTAPPEDDAGEWVEVSYKPVLGGDVQLWYRPEPALTFPLPSGIVAAWASELRHPFAGADPEVPVEIRLTLSEQIEKRLRDRSEDMGLNLLVVLDQNGQVLGTGDLGESMMPPGGVFASIDEAKRWYGRHEIQVSMAWKGDRREQTEVRFEEYIAVMRWHVECRSDQASLYESDYERLKPALDKARSLPPVDCSKEAPALSP